MQFFIVLGFANVVLKPKADYKFDREYVAISAVLLIFVALPLMAPSFNLLNVTRTYHLSLLLLGPFCVVGGESFFSFAAKLGKSSVPFVKPRTLTLVVVIFLFLFETGFIYEITGDLSYSVPLSMYRMNRVLFYGSGYLTEDQDVSGAHWLRSCVDLTDRTLISADRVSVNQPLTSYAVFPRDQTQILSNATSFNGANIYVYLRNFNTRDGKIFGVGRVWNMNDTSLRLEALDKIYTNAGNEILFKP